VYINGDGETSRDFCYDLTVSGALLLLALPIMLLAVLCIYLESGLPVRVG
jgi:lipopolysaccharide/colanic/teichoic acid biosynthesis glycosyltransferase